jgi:hypothetical protein
VLSIVLFGLFLRHICQFHGHYFEALFLDPLQDLANEPALHSIGLDHDEGSFGLRQSLCPLPGPLYPSGHSSQSDVILTFRRAEK